MGDYEYETDSGCLSVRVHLRDPEEKERKSQSIFPYLGIREVHTKFLINCLLAEFFGTMILVLIGCGSCTGGDRFDAEVQVDDQGNIVRISLCFGIVVASLAQGLGHISGCHINPAVTLALVVGRKIGILKGILYIVFQCLGAITGAAILYGIVPEQMRGAGGLGQTTVNSLLSKGNAVAVEMLITALLVLVVFGAAADSVNAPNVKGSAPLAIGLSITACHLWAIPLTGSSMNPARSLGPAVIKQNTDDLWIYWVGPLLGGILAAILYQIVFQARVPEAELPVVERSVERFERPVTRPRKFTMEYRKKSPVSQDPRTDSEIEKLVRIEGIDGKKEEL